MISQEDFSFISRYDAADVETRYLILFVYLPTRLPESFNTNISHQLFDNTKTFVNSQHSNTNSKGDFVLKTQFYLKISGIQNTDADLV